VGGTCCASPIGGAVSTHMLARVGIAMEVSTKNAAHRCKLHREHLSPHQATTKSSATKSSATKQRPSRQQLHSAKFVKWVVMHEGRVMSVQSNDGCCMYSDGCCEGKARMSHPMDLLAEPLLLGTRVRFEVPTSSPHVSTKKRDTMFNRKRPQKMQV
jgi:hypothetical protein